MFSHTNSTALTGEWNIEEHVIGNGFSLKIPHFPLEIQGWPCEGSVGMRGWDAYLPAVWMVCERQQGLRTWKTGWGTSLNGRQNTRLCYERYSTPRCRFFINLVKDLILQYYNSHIKHFKAQMFGATVLKISCYGRVLRMSYHYNCCI